MRSTGSGDRAVGQDRKCNKERKDGCWAAACHPFSAAWRILLWLFFAHCAVVVAAVKGDILAQPFRGNESVCLILG